MREKKYTKVFSLLEKKMKLAGFEPAHSVPDSALANIYLSTDNPNLSYSFKKKDYK